MRFLRVFVIIAVVLAGLFAGVDRWAVSYAENRLGERIQARQGLAGCTEVDIHGFPFLTQALAHDLDRVDVKLTGVEAVSDGRRTRLSQLDAAFRGVKLNGDYSGGTAKHAEGTALVTYKDLTEASQTGVTVTYGGAPGKVKVTAALEFLGRKLAPSVVSTVALVDAPGGGKMVRVRADEVPGEGLPGIEGAVRKKTDFDRRLDSGLPSGLKLTTLTSDESGVHLALSGTDVVLAGS
ncbi:LmeA family phospholipid-binding protein [Streptomyces vinaceus]|uniref:LmeA family phospholipid-binding protein n=1 Tax=Streptomyces vinaceus TaxID=1960 RepID=UPI003680AAAD